MKYWETIYAIRLEDGSIKIGRTMMLRERFVSHRREFGPNIEGLGIALGDSGHESEIKRIFAKSRREPREIYNPTPLLMHMISMMAPFPKMPPVSKQLRKRLEKAA